MNSLSIGIVTKTKELEQILALQERNLLTNISSETFEAEGFLTVKHTLAQLEKMKEGTSQIIAKDGEIVVGFALTMLKSFQNLVPALIPMFNMFESLTYKNKLLHHSNYYVMGQICIDKSYRGQGLFDLLYSKHYETFSSQFDFCVTEVSTRNTRSMKAHERVGFKKIATYKDPLDEWNIVLWDWNR